MGIVSTFQAHFNLTNRDGLATLANHTHAPTANQLGFNFGTLVLNSAQHPHSKKMMTATMLQPMQADTNPSIEQQHIHGIHGIHHIHHIQLKDIYVAYTLKYSVRHSIGFSINSEGLTVIAPINLPLSDITAAIYCKQSWILKKLTAIQRQQQHQQLYSQRWEHGATLPYLGKPIILNVGSGTSLTRLQHGMFETTTLLLCLDKGACANQIRLATYHWLQQEAQRFLAQRIAFYEPLLGVSVKAWRLSNANSRWGSANSLGKIHLHWRLVHMDLALIDYVVVHELAHLKEMNHSPNFWAVVARILPNYQVLRQRLKQVALQISVD